MSNILQKKIAFAINDLVNRGYTVHAVDFTTGFIQVIIPESYSGSLTKEEVMACATGKIYGIKAVREIRNMTLADAKAFVEKHYDFEAKKPR
jgi:ribosomal protein L7/L12